MRNVERAVAHFDLEIVHGILFPARLDARRSAGADGGVVSSRKLDPVEVIVKRDGKVAGKYSVCGGIEVTYHARALVLT